MNEPSHAFKVGVFIFISTLVLLVFIILLGTGLLEDAVGILVPTDELYGDGVRQTDDLEAERSRTAG